MTQHQQIKFPNGLSPKKLLRDQTYFQPSAFRMERDYKVYSVNGMPGAMHNFVRLSFFPTLSVGSDRHDQEVLAAMRDHGNEFAVDDFFDLMKDGSSAKLLSKDAVFARVLAPIVDLNKESELTNPAWLVHLFTYRKKRYGTTAVGEWAVNPFQVLRTSDIDREWQRLKGFA